MNAKQSTERNTIEYMCQQSKRKLTNRSHCASPVLLISHLMRLAIDRHLVALHHLLDGRTDIAQTHTDARLANARIGRVLDSVHQRL
jgi:hypothetical protein